MNQMGQTDSDHTEIWVRNAIFLTCKLKLIMSPGDLPGPGSPLFRRVAGCAGARCEALTEANLFADKSFWPSNHPDVAISESPFLYSPAYPSSRDCSGPLEAPSPGSVSMCMGSWEVRTKSLKKS